MVQEALCQALLALAAALYALFLLIGRSRDKSHAAVHASNLGPLDMFRVYGGFLGVVLVAAFVYGYLGSGVEKVLPGADDAEWTLWLWLLSTIVGIIVASVLCHREARAMIHETDHLRSFWVVELGSLSYTLVLRADGVYTDLATPTQTPSIVFYLLYAFLAAVGFSYILFCAQARFQSTAESQSGYERLQSGEVVEGDAAVKNPLVANGGTVSSLKAPLLAEDEVAAPREVLAVGSDWSERESPEVRSGPLSLWYFLWMTPMVTLGSKKPLEENNLWRLHPSDHPVHLYDLFRTEWRREQTKARPSLFMSLFRAFGPTYMFGALLKFVYDSQQFIGPALMQAIIHFLNQRNKDEDDKPPMSKGYLLVGLLLVNSMTQSVVLHAYFHRAFRTGMRLKSATISAIYDKALRVKPGAADGDPGATAGDKKDGGGSEGAKKDGGKKTTGQIVNLMSVDAQRLQDTMSYVAMLWSGIFQITVSIIYLYDLLGVATFAGIAVMVLSIPLTAKVSTKSRALQKVVMEIKDERIKVENEVLGGMKIIKLYAWERPFGGKIDHIRDEELKALFNYKMLQVGSRVLWTIVPTLVSISSFAVYVMLGNELTAAIAFTSLALFNILRFPLALLPMSVASALEAGLSLERIRSFLVAPEVCALPSIESTSRTEDENGRPFLARSASLGGAGPRVQAEGATLVWDNGTTLLENLDLQVHDGELCVAIGQTGCGKSGLLGSLIGEIEPTQGTIATRGTIAYASQVAWIQNATLKDNVLFGKPFDENKYRRVLHACALLDDLKILPAGDMTEIGEKGINLSGGQKQRVAIARAVYSDADLYLLDDCLSAVDSQVARHIFDHCILGLLGSKAVLLVTHNLQFLPAASTVVLLENKRPEFVGRFEDFISVNHPLAAEAKRQHTDEAGMVTSRSREDLQQLAAGATQETKEPSPDDEDLASAKKQASRDLAGPVKTAEATPAKNTLIEKESMERGDVSLATYWGYITACGPVQCTVGVVGGLMLYNTISVLSSAWLGFWSDNPDRSADKSGFLFSENSALFGTKGYQGLYNYVALSFLGVLATFYYVLSAAIAGQRGCRVYHESLVRGVLRARMEFFDTTPIGRIVNRFSKDVYTVDEQLPVTMYSWVSTLLAVVFAVGTVGFITPWFLAACVPMGAIYYYIQLFYVPTSRELKRLDSVLRSPIFSRFGETLEGASTIRAFRAEDQFIAANMSALERNLRAYYLQVASNRWLAVRLEGIGTLFVVFAALLAVSQAGHTSAGAGGLSITYALSITQVLNWFVRMTSDRESQIVAVERISEYAAVESEAAPIVEDNRPEPQWPSGGKIVFRNAGMRYRDGLPLVLKGLDLEILPSQKVGVVGRTGAGKSSLLLVLLRLVEPAFGEVSIDGKDILRLGLEDLRSRISIIPQDPVLFTGTVRFNLDPFEEHGDDAVWHALDRAHLAPHIRTLPLGLDAEVEEAGRNFSMGERQLLCLARALLRHSRILLLDEATSAVDQYTDGLVQDTIRAEFKNCTVLTIAHRLDTIIDYDRVLVLSQGELIEDGSPQDLLNEGTTPSGHFRAMWEAHQQGAL